jgi:hypothetical protein
MSTIKIMPVAEFEALAVSRLTRVGVDVEAAEAMVRKRFPAEARDVIAEACGRGIALELQDLTDYLHAYAGKDRFFDTNEPITGDAVVWSLVHVEGLLRWAVKNGRGKPGESLTMVFVRPFSVNQLFGELRHHDIMVRLEAGMRLAQSIGAGLRIRGEHEEDFSHILGPQVSDLLGRSMAGESAAADELERRFGHLAVSPESVEADR